MRILLPTDFSDNAALATQFAIDLARRTNGEILCFHAYDIPHYERSMTTALLGEMKKAAENNMAEFETDHLKSAGVPFKSKVSIGNPIRFSKELTEQHNIDIIVMGTKGASGIEEFLIGSNSASVIQTVDVPVLVIPPNSKVKPLQHIVLASDLELKKKERPLMKLREFAKVFNATINILHIQDGDGNESGSRDLVERILGDVPHTYSITSAKEDLDETILNYCESKNADLVAAISKRYGFFQGLFHKSLTSQLAYHTKIPMLALHEPK